jgi:hypothetical protein
MPWQTLHDSSLTKKQAQRRECHHGHPTMTTAMTMATTLQRLGPQSAATIVVASVTAPTKN